jgi:hypothetical protein
MEGPGLWSRETTTSAPTVNGSAADLLNPHTCRRRLAGVEGVSEWGNPSGASARPLCGTAFGSKSSWAERSSPMVTTVEPRRGSMALIPVTPGRLASPAK